MGERPHLVGSVRYLPDIELPVQSFFSIIAQNVVIFNIMEEHLTFGTRILNGFLKVMVVVLVLILIGVVISLILALFGIL